MPTTLGPTASACLRRVTRDALALLTICLGTQTSAVGQCSGKWIPERDHWIERQVYCMRSWDPDGAGPASPLLVFGGSFTRAEYFTAERIVAFDGVGFHTLGAGMTGGQDPSVYCLLEYQGKLLAGGGFTFAGGQAVNGVATWDGSQWQRMGGFINVNPPSIARIYSLCIHKGELYASGLFTHADGQPAVNIARWDGSRWRAIPGPSSASAVRALCSFGGRLIAGGEYYGLSAGQPLDYIAAWDGASWQTIGSGLSGELRCMIVYQSQLVVGGLSYVYRLSANGQQWLPLGSGSSSPGAAWCLAPYQGSLAIVGDLGPSGGQQIRGAALWNGTSLLAMNAGLGGVAYAAAEWMGGLGVGGLFSDADGMPTENWAVWTQRPWVPKSPTDARGCASSALTFSVMADGPGPIQYQWQIRAAGSNWTTPLPGITALECGGTAAASTPTHSQTSVAVHACLGVSNYEVRCVVTNDCGQTVSDSARLDVCLADLNCDQAIDLNDFFGFLNYFDQSLPGADINGDGSVDLADFFAFLNAFDQQC